MNKFPESLVHLWRCVLVFTPFVSSVATVVNVPPQNDELPNDTTLPSSSNSVLAVDISAMSSNHMPNVSLAECVHIGTRSTTSAVRLSSHSKLRARHRNIVLSKLLLSARCVTFHLCPEGRPVGANLKRRSVATDKVRGYLVQPFSSINTSVLIVLAISRNSSILAEHDSGTSMYFAREV